MTFNRRRFIQSMAAVPPLAMIGASGRLLAAPSADPFVAASIAMGEGHLWTMVSVNKAPARLFWIDSGAYSSYIADDYARAAKLKEGGSTQVAGVGGVRNSKTYYAEKVQIGGAFNIDGMAFAGLDWMNGASAEEPSGNLGVGLFMSRDSDFDFIKGEWRIYPAGRKSYEGYYPVTDSYWKRGEMEQMAANIQLGGMAGRCRLDTGYPGWLYLDKSGTEKAALWQSGQPYAPNVARGFGRGRVAARVYRQSRMKMDKFVLENPLVVVTQPGVGLGEYEGVDGLIGMQALRYFHMSWGATAKQLYLKPNGLSAPKDHDYPKSGLWFDRKGDRILIDDVGIGSPAASAGCQIGDEVRGLGWDALLAAVNRPEGATVAFDIVRAGKAQRVEFQLAPYL